MKRQWEDVAGAGVVGVPTVCDVASVDVPKDERCGGEEPCIF